MSALSWEYFSKKHFYCKKTVGGANECEYERSDQAQKNTAPRTPALKKDFRS